MDILDRDLIAGNSNPHRIRGRRCISHFQNEGDVTARLNSTWNLRVDLHQARDLPRRPSGILYKRGYSGDCDGYWEEGSWRRRRAQSAIHSSR